MNLFLSLSSFIFLITATNIPIKNPIIVDKLAINNVIKAPFKKSDPYSLKMLFTFDKNPCGWSFSTFNLTISCINLSLSSGLIFFNASLIFSVKSEFFLTPIAIEVSSADVSNPELFSNSMYESSALDASALNACGFSETYPSIFSAKTADNIDGKLSIAGSLSQSLI